MDNLEFYWKCSEILDNTFVDHSFNHYKRTRWNNRKPGNGRFEGFGLIRVFGNSVHISTKDVNKILDSKEQALEWLRDNHDEY